MDIFQSSRSGRRSTADGRRKEEASAFIVALGVMVVLFIMAITFTTMMIMESRAARNYNDAALCEDVAYGALEEAIGALYRDKYGQDAVGGSLTLKPYNEDVAGDDENWDAWAYPTQPGHDATLWFKSDGGYLSEDASTTDAGLTKIKDEEKSWTANLWQDAVVQVAGQTRAVDSNIDDTITVTEAFDTEPKEGDRYLVFFWYPRDASGNNPTLKPLEGGLSARYAILITDDREARVNLNAAGNLADDNGTPADPSDDLHSSHSGVSVTEVSLQALLQLFNDRDGNPIALADAQALARDIIQNRCTAPAGTPPEPAGQSTTDDDSLRDSPTGMPPVDQNGVDDDADGSVDNETNPLVDEDDEFNLLAAEDDTPFALVDEAAIVSSPADTGSASAAGASSLTDTSKSWTDNEWTDAIVGVDTSGDGIADEFRRVTGNTSDTLNVDSNWTAAGGNPYAIYYGSPLEDDILSAAGGALYTSLRAGVITTGTTGLRLGDCLTTYSAGTIEHPYLDGATLFNSAGEDYIHRRYRFGLNQFEIGAGWPNVTQIDDLKDILETKAGFTEDQAYQFIVNLKDALDGDSTVTSHTPVATTYYGVELQPLVFITEVMREDDPGPPARAYWFIEFYNPSPDPITVFGWDLTITGGPGGSISLANDTIPGNGFYVIGGRAAGYVDRVEAGLLREPLPATDITAVELTCTNEGVLPDGTIIDKADLFAAFDYTTPKSQERPDFKVNQWTEHPTAHTFGQRPYLRDTDGLDNDMDGMVDEALERGFEEKYELFIAPVYRDLDADGGVDDLLNYDIKLANLGDLSRVLLMGYTDPTSGDSISQVFGDVELGLRDYKDIKFDPSDATQRQVLDYLTILNPLGDSYDDDGDGNTDDRGTEANDLGGPEHRIPGMININTASKEVLMALPMVTDNNDEKDDGVTDAEDTDTFADSLDADEIVTYRTGANGPFVEIGELMALAGIDALGSNTKDDNGNGVADEKEEEFLIFGTLSNIVTTHSNVFTVYSLAQVGFDGDNNDSLDDAADKIFAERKLMAIVDRSTQPINIRFLRWLTD